MMNCKKCNKNIDFDSARHCMECGSDYCPECAKKHQICDCHSEIEYYS